MDSYQDIETSQVGVDTTLLRLTDVDKKVIESIPGTPEVVEFVDQIENKRVSSFSVREEQYTGRELKNGEAILIKIPESYEGQLLDSMTLLHRKDSKYDSSDGSGWDTEGAYTRVLVYDKRTESWVSWKDPYKSSSGFASGDKYAEVRPSSNPESEVLYDWIAKVGEISPSHVAIISVGRGEKGITSYHGLDMDFMPQDTEAKQELIFSPGTRFVDLKKV